MLLATLLTHYELLQQTRPERVLHAAANAECRIEFPPATHPVAGGTISMLRWEALRSGCQFVSFAHRASNLDLRCRVLLHLLLLSLGLLSASSVASSFLRLCFLLQPFCTSIKRKQATRKTSC